MVSAAAKTKTLLPFFAKLYCPAGKIESLIFGQTSMREQLKSIKLASFVHTEAPVSKLVALSSGFVQTEMLIFASRQLVIGRTRHAMTLLLFSAT